MLLVTVMVLRTNMSRKRVIQIESGHTRSMLDLHVPPGPGAPRGLLIPSSELVEQFSRASGPGGQGVNTTDSRVQLSLDLTTTSALNDDQRRRALEILAPRLADGVLTISAAEHRSQRRNRVAARERLSSVLREAIMPPTPRRRTKPTRGSQRRRLHGKKIRSEIKKQRRAPRGE